MGSIAVIGETVADAVTATTAAAGTLRLDVLPGGSPANTAVALARLGSHTHFLGRLSTGAIGRLLRRHLEESGVDIDGCVSTDAAATLAVTALDTKGRASYEFYVDGTADWQWQTAELTDWRRPGVTAIHSGSLALALPPGNGVITAFLAGHRERATISIDPNARPGIVAAERYRQLMPGWLELADLIKVSDDDLDYIYPGEEPRRLCEQWHAAGVPLVVVTRGADGATASWRGEHVEVPSRPVPSADTIGAGDAFTAGLLHHLDAAGRLGGRLADLPVDALVEAMEFASLVAARTCAVPGADPPWAADLSAKWA